MISSPLSFARHRYERYGPVSWGRFRGRQMVILLGPDANELLLRDKAGVLSARKAWMWTMGLTFPDGLLTPDGARHRSERRIMSGAFKPRALRAHLEMMTPILEARADDALAGATAGELRFLPWIKRVALEVAATVFMGEALTDDIAVLNQAFIDLVQASGPANLLPFAPIPGTLAHRGREARRQLEGWFRERVPERRRGQGQDFFSLLCRAESEDGERFTDQQVVDQIIFLLMAAHDTAALSSTTLAYRLGQSPDWQERCRAEVDALAGRAPGFDDLAGMTDLGHAYDEALRMAPPVYVYPREATADFTFAGQRIRAGNLLMVFPSFAHRMPELWTDPDRFDPDRFARGEHLGHRYQYVPFGGGAHLCLGMHFGKMEVKALMSAILARWQIGLRPGYRIRYNNVSLSKPWDGLPLLLERRR